jgi:hypothetical protein
VRKPDLKISSLSIQGGEITTWSNVYIYTTVWNDSTGPCNNTFWTDLYVYVYTDTLRVPQPREDGVDYQALSYLGPNAYRDLTFGYTFPMTGTYHLWARADTYENVSEILETNNLAGPVTVTVELEGTPSPTAEPTATPVNPGGIAGTVWVFIGEQLVVPTERVSLYVTNGGAVTTHSDEDGSYRFCVDEQGEPYFCIAAGTNYTVDGWVIIDGTIYRGYQTGIQVVAGETTSPVDIILFP